MEKGGPAKTKGTKDVGLDCNCNTTEAHLF